MSIIAFSGRKHSGKSELGKYVVRSCGYVPEAMARHLKTQCIAFEGLPVSEVWGSYKSPAVRARMVEIGHGYRELHAPDIWLKATEANIYFAYEMGVRKVVLTDIRYPNEVEWVQQGLGGAVFRIVGRGDTTSTEPGEIALDDYTDFGGYINNSGTLDETYELLNAALSFAAV